MTGRDGVMEKYKELIADDEEQFRTTICNCFPWEQWGFEIANQVSNGLEALNFIKKGKVDLIISDIQMPVMSGLELAEKLSRMDSAPIIIFFSGYQEFEYAKKAIVYGVRNYIVKPIRFEELAETLKQTRELLDGKKVVEYPQESFVKTVQDYVQKHLRSVTLSEVADRLYMNQSYVSQLYKQKTGINFSDYALSVRMKTALELLKNPQLRIYEVGEAVGYNNANNFTRTFRSYYGMTPKAYQEKNKYQSYYSETDRELQEGMSEKGKG